MADISLSPTTCHRCICLIFAIGECVSITSHEEEQASHIVHEALVPAAAQYTNGPAKEDDGQGHAHEACCHTPQVYRKER